MKTLSEKKHLKLQFSRKVLCCVRESYFDAGLEAGVSLSEKIIIYSLWPRDRHVTRMSTDELGLGGLRRFIVQPKRYLFTLHV